jgi:hypothetical protein
MACCEPALYQLLAAHIEPSKAQKDGAVRSHNNLRSELCDGRFGNRIIDTYLTGSYKRDTAVRPLEDVDIVVLIDPSHWDIPWYASKPDPGALLQSFARAVRNRYPTSRVQVQRRSVGLKLTHLDLDVVPAIDQGNDMLLIADRSDRTWIRSGPKRHTDLALTLNAKRAMKLKPLVKLLKQWNNNLPSTAHVKSFTIETIALRLFEHVGFSTLDEGLLIYFDFLAHFQDQDTHYQWKNTYGMSFGGWNGITIPDTAGSGSNVAARLGGTQVQRFLEHAARARNKLEDAVEATFDDTAFRYIAKVLGFEVARAQAQ